jgi:NitT/TauT family transport system ATP-binding protein
MEPAEKIVVKNLTKSFNIGSERVLVIDDMSFEVSTGEFFCIVGPSGCGKTTLLRILAGLETKTAGSVSVGYSSDGAPPNAMVFQEHSVFPWMTVEENVEFGLLDRVTSKAGRRQRVAHNVALVGLTEFAKAYPHQLSGGMKQRVSIARALAADPDVLLMDEPFGALDEQTRILLQDELLRIWDHTRKTVVFITHSIEEAVSLGDRVLVMSARPGRVKLVQSVPFERPRGIAELRREPAFGQQVYSIWESLRDEVLRSRDNAEPGSKPS